MQTTIKNIKPETAKAIARSYHVLQRKPEMIRLGELILPREELLQYSKPELHKLFNDVILRYYSGEVRIKSMLVEHFEQEKVVAAFEIKTPHSRLDFLRVNGDTISYEVKSEVDSLHKLPKQVEDYNKLFEYNYLVTDYKHLDEASKLIPENYGIYVSDRKRLTRKRRARKNQNLCSEHQLRVFTKKELRKFFKGTADREFIVDQFGPESINYCFREMLKARYQMRWHFLKDNKKDINPVDFQYFFHHNVEPELLYKDKGI